MTTAVEPKVIETLEPEQRVVLRDVGWEGYENLLAMAGDGPVRLTFDGKDLELMSPSVDHEAYKGRFGQLIEILSMELDIDCESLGSATWKKQFEECGLEADECFYFANAEAMVGRRVADLEIHPPPDLAVEIAISRGSLNRMKIYAKLGVPEVWRFDGKILTVVTLRRNGQYKAASKSLSLPFLPLDEVVRWVHLGRTMGQTPWLRQFRDWVRDDLAPKLGES